MSRLSDTHNHKIGLISVISFLAIILSLSIVMANAMPPDPDKDKKQIFITKDNIKNYTSKGDYTDPEYTSYYNVTNLFDNVENSISYWSQKGPSNFEVKFNNSLENPICSVKIGVYNPTLKTPYDLTIFNSSGTVKANGQLNNPNQEINFDNCISKADKILMSFKPVDMSTNAKATTALSEMRLYTDTNIINPPPLECPDGEHIENGVCVPDVIVPPPPPPPPPPIGSNQTITNSTILLDISNSDVQIQSTNSSMTFPNITLPEIPDIVLPPLVNTTFPPPPPPPDTNSTTLSDIKVSSDDKEKEEEEPEDKEEGNGDDEKDKKGDKDKN